MHIAICDDNIIFLQALCRFIEQWATELHYASIAIHQFVSSEEALQAWERGLPVDMFILDIEIPGEMTGMELAAHIRAADKRVMIAFASNYTAYACQGYEVDAVRFLSKPIDKSRLYECLETAYRQWKMAQEEFVVLDVKGCRTVMDYRDILYAEANGHYLIVHQTFSNEYIRTRMSVLELLSILQNGAFVRCHKGFVVNLLYVRRVGKDALLLAGGVSIPLGRKYYADVSDKFDEMFQGIRK